MHAVYISKSEVGGTCSPVARVSKAMGKVAVSAASEATCILLLLSTGLKELVFLTRKELRLLFLQETL